MVAKNSPDLLPAGWTVQSRVQKNGRKVKYYSNLETGQKFYSKKDLDRFVKMGNINCNKHQSTDSQFNKLSSEKHMQLVETTNESPEWLPKGWIWESKIRNSGSLIGREYKIYVDPSSGQKFKSKPEVLRYLKSLEHDSRSLKQKELDFGLQSKEINLVKANESPEWLPKGWIWESKTRKKGLLPGREYKIYVDPSTGQKFYSKPEVLRYLKSMEHDSGSLKQKKLGFDSQSKEIIVEKANESPEWLPKGWICESKTRKYGSTIGREYKIYVDPSTGQKFYSKPEVLRYLKSLEHDRSSLKQKKFGFGLQSKEIPPSATKKQKLTHRPTRQQPFTEYTVASMGSSEGRSLVLSTVEDASVRRSTRLSDKTRVASALTTETPQEKHPRENVVDKVTETKEGPVRCSSRLLITKSSSKKQGKKVSKEVCSVPVPIADIPEGEKLVENGMEEPKKRKSRINSSSTKNKKILILSRRHSTRLAGLDKGAETKESTDLSSSCLSEAKAPKRKQVGRIAARNKPVSTPAADILQEEILLGNTTEKCFESEGSPDRSSSRLLTAKSSSKKQGKKGSEEVGSVQVPTADISEGKELVDNVKEMHNIHSSKQKETGFDMPARNVMAGKVAADGLPPGWILEIKVRKNGQRDPFYTDPVTGYVFRSRKDVLRYLETGEISRHAFKPKNRSISNSEKIANENSPPSAAKKQKRMYHVTRRQLFAGEESFQVSSLAPVNTDSTSKRRTTRLSAKARLVCGLFTETSQVKHSPENLIGNCSEIKGNFYPSSSGLSEEASKRKQAERVDTACKPISTLAAETDIEEERSLANLIEKLTENVESPDKSISGLLTAEVTNRKLAKRGFEEAESVPVLAANIQERDKSLEKGKVKRSNTKTQINLSNIKNQNEPSLARRSSKRLSGVGTELVVDSKSSEQAFRVASNLVLNGVAHEASQEIERRPEFAHGTSVGIETLFDGEPLKPLEDQTIPEEEMGTLKDPRQDGENLEPQPKFPYTDSWTDPCLEFAFKTLTGAIPIESNLDAQDCFQKQADATHIQMDGGLDFSNNFLSDGSSQYGSSVIPVSKQQLPVNPSFFPQSDLNLPSYNYMGPQHPSSEGNNDYHSKSH